MSMMQEQPPYTILVVDDTPANLEVAVSHLEESGYRVLVAQGGEEALSRARRVQPDLILLDVMMPGIDGFETCRRLKKLEAVEDVPVVFMTALTETEDKVTAFGAGGVDYVTKPFQIEELLARVRTHLALRTAQLRLQASEIRYRRLFETSRDGILLVDLERDRVTDVNASLIEMLGLPREDIVGKRPQELAVLRDAPGQLGLGRLLLHEQVPNEHWALQRSDGTSFDVELRTNAYQVNGTRMVQCNLRDITERKQAETRIRYLALHDALTSLPNRVLLQDRLTQAIHVGRRHGEGLAVMMLDLDHFKNINDSLGHHIGDRLLESVAQRLLGCVRESDIVARLGGDEFVITLLNIDSCEAAEHVARKILHTLAEPFVIDSHELHTSASIGISRYPADGEDPGTLLRAADSAMYHAKSEGRGTLRFFTAAMSEAAQRRLMLTNDVRHAADRGELAIYYQPQVAANSGAVMGVEALLRWQHPRHGMISPEEFVPLLEETGLIVEVGNWVLRNACKQAVAWHQEGLPKLRMAVNLSSQQFYRGDIVRTVAQALEESGLAPECLELELTESLTLDDTEQTIKLMHELKRLGVCLSLDDFGTGWSSLSYLRRFPLDRIKIDRSFLRDMVSQPAAAAVVRSIMRLARTLGLSCIAEGVETPEQLAYLRRQMCAEIQGFLFSPAIPDAELDVMLRKTRGWAEQMATLSSRQEPVEPAPTSGL